MLQRKDESCRNRRRSVRALLWLVVAAVCFLSGFWLALILSGAVELQSDQATPAAGAESEPAEQDEPETDFRGRWHVFRRAGVVTQVEEARRELAENMEQILALGYVDGSMPAPGAANLVYYDRNAAYPGYNIYSSGHAADVTLMDMECRVLHVWQKSFAEIWPNVPPEERPRSRWFVRRFHVFPNGDILLLFRDCGLVKLNSHSEILWVYSGKVHHDLFVGEKGTIHVLLAEDHVVSRVNAKEKVREDFIVTLDANGQEVSRFSLLGALEASPYRTLMQYMPKERDLFHTNTLELLDGRLANRCEAFAAGNFLISIWTLDTIAVVDPSAKQITWAQCGLWRKQHQPTVLDNGNLLVFDNLGYDGYSQVIELDPFSQEIAWTYHGTPPEAFLTTTCGSCQRLPNGNTLVTESDNGRAMEITPDKRTVWEFINPNRAGKGGFFIATLFEVIRLPQDFPIEWAKNADLPAKRDDS